MPIKRSAGDLTIHVGKHRDFEWYWASSAAMPGLDAYESLAVRDQDDFLASVVHWGDVPPGAKALQTRINTEHESPLIVAIKAGKQRFTAFREEHGSTWIVSRRYVKEGERRDKTGDRTIRRAIADRTDYLERVREGTYYERS
ncbi:MAG: hypothetical protein ACYCX6_03555 [Vulcanimicrobiaceae bacterium]